MHIISFIIVSTIWYNIGHRQVTHRVGSIYWIVLLRRIALWCNVSRHSTLRRLYELSSNVRYFCCCHIGFIYMYVYGMYGTSYTITCILCFISAVDSRRLTHAVHTYYMSHVMYIQYDSMLLTAPRYIVISIYSIGRVWRRCSSLSIVCLIRSTSNAPTAPSSSSTPFV